MTHHIGQEGHYRLSREARRGFFMLDNRSLRPTGCTSSSPAAASTLKRCCGSAAEDPLSPDITTLKKITKEKAGDMGRVFSQLHEASSNIHHGIRHSNRKNQKLSRVLKAF